MRDEELQRQREAAAEERQRQEREKQQQIKEEQVGEVVLFGVAHLAPPVNDIFSKFSGFFLFQESQRKQRDAEERVRVEKENAERRRREEQEAAEAARLQQRQQQEEQQRRADQERQQAETVRKGSLFVFLIVGPKQNAGSLFTHDSDTVFYAL